MRALENTYEDRTTGRWRSRRCCVEFHDHMGIPRRLAAFADLRATEALRQNIERLVRCKANGETLDSGLWNWIQALSPRLRESLRRVGLLDAAPTKQMANATGTDRGRPVPART